MSREEAWFGQPRGLTILFLTNMWEQFSYFGMRALLVYYMTTTLLFEQEKASSIYGFYTAFAYFTPIIGGTIADRWLGKRRAVIIGASVMAAGHFMMAFEPAFYFALATIAIGNGLFLPTLPSQINDLYEANDPRRPAASRTRPTRAPARLPSTSAHASSVHESAAVAAPTTGAKRTSPKPIPPRVCFCAGKIHENRYSAPSSSVE